MNLRNGITLKEQLDVAANTSRPPQTNLQLEGFWLHLARGAWISFILVELPVLVLSLVATRGESYSICPFLASCTVTPATAQALHHLSIAPSSYVTYNVMLALLQSLIFLSVGVFIFWRKSNEPIALVASFFLVSIGLSPFFQLQALTSSLEVIFLNIYVLCIFTALGYFLMTFPDGHFVPRWSWLLLALWTLRTIFFLIPAPYVQYHDVATCAQCNRRDCELRRYHRFDDLSLRTHLESLTTAAGKVAPLRLRRSVCADYPV